MTTLDLIQFPVHTSLATSDLERAKTWYRDKLGLSPDQENGGIWFRFAGDPGSTFIKLAPPAPPRTPSPASPSPTSKK